jgi:hypothetical protein
MVHHHLNCYLMCHCDVVSYGDDDDDDDDVYVCVDAVHLCVFSFSTIDDGRRAMNEHALRPWGG